VKRPRKEICVFSFILFIGILGCSSGEPRISAITNKSAPLVGQLPANPLAWRVITSMIDRTDSTMSTLYGNDLAVGYIRTHSQHDYPAGSVLSLITWAQQEDPRWFGARIPATVKSVEFVTVSTAADGSPSYSYTKYEGAPLKESSAPGSATGKERAAYLVSQRAAVMP
jgi:hypothetical protein